MQSIDSVVQLNKTKIYNNIAKECAGLEMDDESNLTISNSYFYQNLAINKVGVLNLFTNSYMTVTNSEFTENYSRN